MQREGSPMRCDCGCNQIMAIEYRDRVVVKAEHHGKNHFLTVWKAWDISQDRQRLRDQVASSTN